MNKNIIAALSMFFGAVLFSAKAVLVKLAYQYDVDSTALLALRMLLALPFYIGVLLWAFPRKKPKISFSDWLGMMFFGIAGYYLASLFDFMGLQYIDASLERIILFAYPTIVVIISFLFFKPPIKSHQVIALFITYLGIGITFSEQLFKEDSTNFYLGAGLIFLAAITYAIYLVGSGRYLPKFGTWILTSIAMIFAASAIILHNTWVNQLQLWHFHPNVYFYAFLMAFISTVLPTFLVSEAIRMIGASNAAIIGSVGPISTIVMAYFFLGEGLSWLQLFGTVIVIGGVLMITLNQKK